LSHYGHLQALHQVQEQVVQQYSETTVHRVPKLPGTAPVADQDATTGSPHLPVSLMPVLPRLPETQTVDATSQKLPWSPVAFQTHIQEAMPSDNPSKSWMTLRGQVEFHRGVSCPEKNVGVPTGSDHLLGNHIVCDTILLYPVLKSNSALFYSNTAGGYL
jgi:hypothetical protein